MSWSLRIENGDFRSSRGSLDVARNQTKLVQDLRCFILEEMGTDKYHPSYGSKINDATTIGVDADEATSEIESEIQRIVALYQRNQVSRARDDNIARGVVSLDQGEVLVALNSINFEQKEDRLTVRLVIQTGDSSNIDLSINL